MKFHTTLGCALGLLIGLGAESQAAPEKPLDITQFMREQAASTRMNMPRQTHPRATAKVHHPARRANGCRREKRNLDGFGISCFERDRYAGALSRDQNAQRQP